MQRNIRKPFIPTDKFQCGRPFVMDGVQYKTGDSVPTHLIETRRVRQMYEARMLEVGAGTSKPATEPKTEPAQESVVSDSGSLRARHKGFNRWYVEDASGATIKGPMTKEEADSYLLTA